MDKSFLKIKRKYKRLSASLKHFTLRCFNSQFRSIVDSPIFIVGCGHSGTTLVLRVIGAHPEVHPILDESQTFEKNKLYKLKRFDLAAQREGKTRWVEKTPRHILHLADIFKARPAAKVLLIIRDGRDVAVSVRNRTGHLEDGIERWMGDNQAGEKWWSDPRVKVLRYEELIEDFDAQLRSMLEFLDLKYSDDCRNYNEKVKHPEIGHQKPESAFGDNHLEYRMWQVSQPLFDGRARWKKGMNDEDKAKFKEAAGDMLIRYQYESSMDW